MYLVVDNLIESNLKIPIKQTDTKDKTKDIEIENSQNFQNSFRRNPSNNQLNPNKLEHKKIVNIHSVGIVKNYA